MFLLSSLWMAEERKDKSLASFKLSKISSFMIQSMSQVWAMVGTAVAELKHTVYSHDALQVTSHPHGSAAFKADESSVGAGLLRTK